MLLLVPQDESIYQKGKKSKQFSAVQQTSSVIMIKPVLLVSIDIGE